MPLLLLVFLLTGLLVVGGVRHALAAATLGRASPPPPPARPADIAWWDCAARLLHFAGCSATLSHFFSPLLYRLGALAGTLRFTEHALPAPLYKSVVDGFAALRGNTVAGIVVAAVAVIYADMLKNYTYSLLLLTQTRFKIGDWIKILSSEGRVFDITGDHGIVLHTRTGRVVFVPAPSAAAAVVEVWPADREPSSEASAAHASSPAAAERKKAA